MKFEISHTFTGIDLESYEKLFFDDHFNDLLKPVSGLKKREVLESREEGGVLYRKVRIYPERDFPGPIKKLIQGELSYTEDSWLDRAKHQLRYTSKVSVLTDKINIAGEIRFSAAPNGARRVVSGEVKVDVFGIGKMIETSVVDNIKETYDKIAAFTQRYIDEKKHVAQA